MKNRLNKLLVPAFLQRLDDYLLDNYPVVWRTRGHFVLFYSITATILLFTAGFFYPVDAKHLTVDPYEPVILVNESYFRYFTFAVMPFVLYWAYIQYSNGYNLLKFNDTVITTITYSICFWFILSFVLVSFRVGMIYRTANYWIAENEVNFIKEKSINSYGINLRNIDTLFFKKKSIVEDKNKKYQAYSLREQSFNTFYKNLSDSVSLFRYSDDLNTTREAIKKVFNNDTLDFFFKQKDFNREESIIGEWISHSEYISSSHIKWIPLSEGGFSYQFFLNRSIIDRFKFKVIGSAAVTDFFSNKIPKINDDSLLYFNGIINDYFLFKEDSVRLAEKRLTPFIKKYKFATGIDSLSFEIDSSTVYFFRHQLPYSIKHSILSIENAKAFLGNKIFWNHVWVFTTNFFYFISFMSLLLFFVPFLNSKTTLITAITNIVLWSVANLILFDSPVNTDVMIFSKRVVVYLLFPTIALIIFIWSLITKAQSKYMTLATHFIAIGILLTWASSAFSSDLVISNQRLGLPHKYSFFAVQIIGFIAIMLIPKIRQLPKQI